MKLKKLFENTIGNIRIECNDQTTIIKISNTMIEFNNEMWPEIKKYIDRNIKLD